MSAALLLSHRLPPKLHPLAGLLHAPSLYPFPPFGQWCLSDAYAKLHAS
jgi:hypothetical protein